MRLLSRILLVVMALAALILFWPGARAQQRGINTCSNCPVTETTTILAFAPGVLNVQSVARINGPQCDHFLITVCDGGTGGGCAGGTVRTIRTDRGELDALFEDQSRAEAARELVLRTVAYRRREGLTLTGEIR